VGVREGFNLSETVSREHREKQEEKRISGRKVDVVKGRAVPQ
jgi:hypothetical protein